MTILDPTRTRLSPHFLLSDMIGCQSVYSKGLPNVFDHQRDDIRLVNGLALCEHVLEPLLALAGPFSISYGFISQELSREIVTYQDPTKPSHHMWNLGAAVDVCVHRHVLQSTSNNATNESGAPIVFAMDYMQDYPLSRLITYSESPYMCLAVSDEEVANGTPRRAWYENRYLGVAKAKPLYLKYPTPGIRTKAWQRIQDEGLPHPWAGKGYPTYHGGGIRQLHHIRTSKNTMVSDWLFDEDFVRNGVRNRPSLDKPEVVEAFELAGKAYDYLLSVTGLPRLSIVSGYTSHMSEGWIAGRDWREGDVSFEVVPPSYLSPGEFIAETLKGDHARSKHMLFANLSMIADGDRVIVTVRRSIEW